jgi:phosphoglycolate phosphatase-like HAD superfamily hydrolase
MELDKLGVRAEPELLRETSDHYPDLCDGGLRLFPRATDVLERLRGHGQRLRLVTNGSSRSSGRRSSSSVSRHT